jgi:acetolactate synthase-1/2/3 large subunit
MLGIDLMESAHPLYFGGVGLYSGRSGNFSIQNCDAIVALGCRLAPALVGYNPKTFARDAKIACVDLDPAELDKKTVPIAVKICCDLNAFFDSFSATLPDYSPWLDKCSHWKSKWLFEIPPDSLSSPVINPYYSTKMILERFPAGKIVSTGSGTVAIIVTQLINVKKGDRFIWSTNQGDMGQDLPMSIGSHLADPAVPYVIFTSEGTLQFNIQEFQTIVHHKLPLKIIVYNNASYGAIEITQTTFFKAKFGVDQGSGLSFPDTEKIAAAYGIPYVCARTNDQLEAAVAAMLAEPGPVIMEVFVCIQTRFPKLSSKKNDDGSFTSLPFEDMEPFMSREDFVKEIIVAPLKECIY